MQMHIEVNKISVITKKTEDGTRVKNPLDKSPVKTETKIVKETIRIDEIKSARDWHKSVEEECSVEGSITMIYLMGDKTREAASMKINEDYDSFADRLNVIRANG
jgi:hypothetical protein